MNEAPKWRLRVEEVDSDKKHKIRRVGKQYKLDDSSKLYDTIEEVLKHIDMIDKDNQ